VVTEIWDSAAEHEAFFDCRHQASLG